MQDLKLGLVSIGDAMATSAMQGSEANVEAQRETVFQEPTSSTQVVAEARHVRAIADPMSLAQ